MIPTPRSHLARLAAACLSCASVSLPIAAPALAAPALVTQADAPARAVLDYADTVAAIFDECLTRGRSYELLSELCTRAPHRLAGSPGADEAVRFGLEAMRAAGLENVRAEPCTVPRWVRGERAELVLVGEDGNEQLGVLALGGSVATPPEGLEAELVCVRTFEELAALGDAARGRIVLFCRPMDPTELDPFEAYLGAVDQRSRGAVEAARAGALAALVRSMSTALDDVPHTGALSYAEDVPRVPGAALGTRTAERLAALCERGPVTVRLGLDCETLEDVESANVVGEIVGRERPNEIVVVAGHLDAWDIGQGAHDDGAGCVQALEALRVVKALGLQPRRTLRCVLYMNEENGMRGAFAYRDRHREALGGHVLALESDRGGFTPRGFTTDARGAAFEMLRSIAALLEPAGAGALVPGGGGVDISPLADHGVPLVGFWPDPQRYFDLHHSQNDVLAAVHPRELALGAGAIAALVYVAADLEHAWPRNLPLETEGDGGR